MSDILFHREDYPFAILEEFGLTAQMILDLPESVHLRLQRGAFSPLLPIKIEQPNGYTRCYAKFCLIETDEGVNLLFSPKLEQLDLNQFSEEEKQLLLSGKAIVADIMESNENDAASSQRIKVFVQIDPDTNNVVYTPSQIIGRNLSSIGQEFNLSEEVLESFWKGKTATIESDIFDEDQPVELTIGIDLFSKTGVMVVYGNAEDWDRAVRLQIPDYSFGNDGCWVKRSGLLSYVEESDFTEEIEEALERMSQENQEGNFLEQSEQIEKSMDFLSSTRQQTR